MSGFGEEKKVEGVFGGIEIENANGGIDAAEIGGIQAGGVVGIEGLGEAGTIQNTANLPTKIGFWGKFKSFWLQKIDWNKEITIELTPYQQKVEDEINEFLHQDITWEKVHNFLFQEIKFRK